MLEHVGLPHGVAGSGVGQELLQSGGGGHEVLQWGRGGHEGLHG
jgi:hypothetical protein